MLIDAVKPSTIIGDCSVKTIQQRSYLFEFF